MKILGVDPGYGRTGWGIIEYENNQPKFIECGLIETFPKMGFNERLRIIYDELSILIYKSKVECMAVETLFFNKNVKTAILAAHARGVTVLAGVKAKISVYDYTPLQIKNALVGYGRGSKDQIRKMLEMQLGVKGEFDQDDAADGVACAVTHAYSMKSY